MLEAMGSLLPIGVFVAVWIGATAHYCSDGSRIQCMAVRSVADAPSSFGLSYDARGYPLCTLEGKRVYCLIDHDYHDCSTGHAPCCADGSNPAHGGSTEVGHDTGECASEGTTSISPQVAMSSMGTEVVTASAAAMSMSIPVQIILDNMDSTLTRDMANAFEGSYQPCMKDAYKGQFHHDWARNKGTAHFSMSFDPPRTGCYKIEEYHPGSDYSCSRYLPRNAQLDVDYCRGMSKTLHINQAVQGAQWNEIDHLMFHQGHQGRFTMKNQPGEQCDTGSCFWVADAFRLTWIRAECNTSSSASTHAMGQPEVVMLEQEQVASQTPARDEEITAGSTDGVLVLRASLANDRDGSLLDLQVKLRDHASVLESSLQAHLGGIDVTVSDISLMSRRLHTNDHTTSAVGVFRVSFVVHSIDIPAMDDGLSQKLQSALTTANAGVEIASAQLEWPGPANPASTESSSDSKEPALTPTVIIGVAVGAVVFTACIGMLLLVAGLRYKKAQHSQKQNDVKSKEGGDDKPQIVEVSEKDAADIEDGTLKEKSADACEMASNTTGTPSDAVPDENHSAEGCSSQDSPPTAAAADNQASA